jgi:hypothetical protein
MKIAPRSFLLVMMQVAIQKQICLRQALGNPPRDQHRQMARRLLGTPLRARRVATAPRTPNRPLGKRRPPRQVDQARPLVPLRRARTNLHLTRRQRQQHLLARLPSRLCPDLLLHLHSPDLLGQPLLLTRLHLLRLVSKPGLKVVFFVPRNLLMVKYDGVIYAALVNLNIWKKLLVMVNGVELWMKKFRH